MRKELVFLNQKKNAINDNMFSKNSLLIFSGIVVAGLIIGGSIIYTDGELFNFQSASSSEIIKDKQELGQGGHVKGNPDASITIVEFSDFECSFCAKFNQTMNKIMKDYPNDVKWVYRHFPLAGYKNARPSAEASECANEQGKFWEFHDQLFENQLRLGKDLYSEIAQELELNISSFESCLSSRKYKDKVEKDYQDGVKAGVSGTPGNFINDIPLGGALPYEQLKKTIDNLLNK